MYPDDPARLCEKCSVFHIENCDLCFGFGLIPIVGHDETVPVPAVGCRAPELVGPWIQCPLCEGTPYGIAGSLLRLT